MILLTRSGSAQIETPNKLYAILDGPGAIAPLQQPKLVDLFGRMRLVTHVMSVGDALHHFRLEWFENHPEPHPGAHGPGNKYGGCCLSDAMSAEEVIAALK